MIGDEAHPPLVNERDGDPGDWIDDQIADIRAKARGMAATSG
jgi:hypothetical protein